MTSHVTKSSFRESLQGIPYTETVAARPPIQITNAINRQSRQLQQLEKERQRQRTPTKLESKYERKDATHIDSSSRNSQSSLNATGRATRSLTSTPSIPLIRIDQEEENNANDKERSPRISSSEVPISRSPEPFRGIAVDLPAVRLSEEFAPENVRFSNRGSMLIDGKKANLMNLRREPSKRLDAISDTPDSDFEDNEDNSNHVASTVDASETLSTNVDSQFEKRDTSSDNMEHTSNSSARRSNSLNPDLETPNSRATSPDIRAKSPSSRAKTPSLRANTPNPQANTFSHKPDTPPPSSEKQESDTDRLNPPSNPSARTSTEPVLRTDSARSRKPTKILSTDEDLLSVKVRSFYAFGSDTAYDTDAQTNIANRMGLRWQDAMTAHPEGSSILTISRATSTVDISTDSALQENEDLKKTSSIIREDYELAGGVEDWQDVNSADVDRYGFIIPRADSTNGINGSGPQKLSRVSTSLQRASDAPRKRATLNRPPSSAQGSTLTGFARTVSSQSLRRPASAQSTRSLRRSTFRSKDQKLMDEAGDMLTLPRSFSARIVGASSASEDPRARRKEIEREEKWRKMARPVPPRALGGGMTFDFDTHNPKLIERTWKGIPDKWRATAWHAFLSTSARQRKDSLSDDHLISAFADYQEQSSPDDVQIDIDVPRTINSHIMFRRRYRGGQRLLFRVLHAMSLHFAETGYVQGMAALAATLLAYYEEEKAFVMLVRLWELRGLDQLYKSGFGGLMAALDTFERDWLGAGEVGAKLTDLGIGPTAYGTRWYLTLFNYSIPFPAQLRVWDVFMLLGDDAQVTSNTALQPFGTTLDVLHATAAALIDGMRDILMESDFENAMKVLTSWVPIRDEDLFMRVARAEWKMHKRKA